eukprot:TRINITY_DN93382_c0_g1_i1.p1 TRINITY_DN93382_c0_g1~~TRINITY_DN93382_c0_g1_i1.p1  ORF type:complete len:204 (-),score=56.88 TRINITY_DN93382_c0_g1_i1:302-913(-)
MALSKLLVLALAATISDAATELEVKVYEGPTECDNADKVAKGSYLKMHYTGTIDASSPTGSPGSKFDSSRDRDETFDFQIGQGEVIQGWDQGIVGLCKGAKATIVVPSAMGYGDDGAGADIPGGATLNFDVEVVDISEKPWPEPNYFKMIDTDKDGKISKDEMLAYFKGEIPDGLMDQDDKDKDGFISWAEFSGPKGEDHKEL